MLMCASPAHMLMRLPRWRECPRAECLGQQTGCASKVRLAGCVALLLLLRQCALCGKPCWQHTPFVRAVHQVATQGCVPDAQLNPLACLGQQTCRPR